MVNQNNSSQESEKSPSDDDKNLINIAQYVKDVQQSHKGQYHLSTSGTQSIAVKWI